MDDHTYRIGFRAPDGKRLWAGANWHPYRTKSAAIKVRTRHAAETYLANIQRISAANPHFEILATAEIVTD